MSGKKTFSVRPFDKLRKTMEQHAASAAPSPPRQKKKEEYTDKELFENAMDGVQEIEIFRELSCAHRPRRRAQTEHKADPEQEAEMEDIIARYNGPGLRDEGTLLADGKVLQLRAIPVARVVKLAAVADVVSRAAVGA